MDLIMRLILINMSFMGLINKQSLIQLVVATDPDSEDLLLTRSLPDIDIRSDLDALEMISGSRIPFRSSNISPRTNGVSGCTELIEQFSDAAASFTKCSILNARPLRFCEYCVKEYSIADELYLKLIKGQSVDDAGSLCSETILNSDRVQIVVKVANFIHYLWTKCDCQACYDVHKINGTVEYTLNNDTDVIVQLFNETLTCFQTYGNFTGGIEPFVKPANTSINSTAICLNCTHIYKRLNKFYYHLEEKYPDGVCMDIIDVMNATRIMWSRTFACSHPHVDPLPVVLLATFVCLLPVIFYTANKIHGTKMEKKLLKQKRMKEEDNSTSTSNSFATSTTTNTT